MQIRASESLSITLPYNIIFTLRQDNNPTGNPEKKPILVHWSPYQALTSHKIILSHRGKEGLKELDVEGQPSKPKKQDQETSIDPHELFSIAPDGILEINAGLPIEYYKLLQVGEKYSLMWAGDEIKSWSFMVSIDPRRRKNI